MTTTQTRPNICDSHQVLLSFGEVRPNNPSKSKAALMLKSAEIRD
jgi:hypothetical protein